MSGCPHVDNAPPGMEQAVLRWKLGHQMFHLHLAAMNTLLDDARMSLNTQSWVRLAGEFEELTVLYDAATATMRYAADFSQELYEKMIRPSMAPPFLSPGFSGTLNLEHEHMLQRLTDVRRRFKETDRNSRLPDQVRTAASRLWAAQSRNRRNHMLVCEKFVPNGTSLLSDYFKAQKSDTPLEMVEE